MKNSFIKFIVLSLVLFGLVGCAPTFEVSETPEVSTVSNDLQTTEIDNGSIPSGRPGGGLGNSSIDTTNIKKQYLEVAYGTVSESQTLNIYLPNEGEGPFPVIIAIHGGAFMFGNATGGDVAAMLEGVNRGYAVVSINYRLSGEATFPAAVNDVRSAVRFIKANAESYQLNANKIAVWGDSAGGNLAAMIGTTASIGSLNGDNPENLDYSSAVQVVVDWFGPLDFLKMDEQFVESGITPAMGKTCNETSPESQYIGELITENPELTQQANPITYITSLSKESAPYFLIEHGTADANVPTQQSINFSEALKSQIGNDKVTLVLLDGAGHGTAEFTTQENLNKVFDFLDKILK
jgi:acetyl esterase/lipase